LKLNVELRKRKKNTTVCGSNSLKLGTVFATVINFIFVVKIMRINVFKLRYYVLYVIWI